MLLSSSGGSAFSLLSGSLRARRLTLQGLCPFVAFGGDVTLETMRRTAELLEEVLTDLDLRVFRVLCCLGLVAAAAAARLCDVVVYVETEKGWLESETGSFCRRRHLGQM